MATTIAAFAVLLPLASVTTPTSPAGDRAGDMLVATTVHAEEAVATSERSATEHTHADDVDTAAATATTSTTQAARVTVARPVTANVVQASAAQPASTDAEGCTWEVRRGKNDSMQLSMRHGRSQHGRSIPLASLEGLTAAQLSSGGPVRFQVRRDAGTFAFDGTARDGVAGGVCSFTPSPTFGAELARRGVSGLTAGDQQEMARHDVGLALVDELRTQKYATPTVADLVKAGQHGVHVEYVRGMGALGYVTGTLEPLITLRDHGVTPDYAKALASFGYKSLPSDQLQRARDHGVTADYLQGMRDGGFGSLPLDEMITTRDHGVTPDRIKQANAKAGTQLSVSALRDAASHGWR